VHAVIDHHPNSAPPDAPFFRDIRPEYGAASTIITGYLREAGCPIPPKLATALFNGIKTDTAGLQRDASDNDVECYKTLFDLMDHRLLAEIENPARDMDFFRTLHKATEAAARFGNVGYAHLDAVKSPDSVAEMAEHLHSWEKLEWMICTGIFKKQIFFSIRSAKDNSAGTRAERLAARFGGSGGGHAKAAAGRIPINGDAAEILAEMERFIKEVFGVTGIDKETLL
jgi:nanoRNase/pAp phosphatase (c-di-AMP/oligoRNAs hydrolase)